MASKETVSTKARHLRQLLRVAIGQEEIGRRIAQAREEAGLTQAQMAERLGLAHPQSISKYERGETEVPPKRLRRIAEVTGKPIGFFVMAAPGEEPLSPQRNVMPMPSYLEQVIDRILQGGPETIRHNQELLEGMLGELRQGALATLEFVGRVEALIRAAASEGATGEQRQ
jgi:transcriptional regulator with XRE-family HTH domain